MPDLLPPEHRTRYVELAVRARKTRESGDIPGAERWLLEAWNAIPEPKLDWAEGQISVPRG